ncbi:MAG: 23S rRNA (uracil(1939)-C(5))-methyltransferase RlmD [Planctomycetota bacterium JB042]
MSARRGRPAGKRRAKGKKGRATAAADPAAVPVRDATSETSKPVRCIHFGPCGGCDHLDLFYREEIARKRDALGALLEESPLARFDLLPIARAREPLFYRTSLKVPFGKVGDRVVAGFFRPGTHGIVDLNECAIQHPVLTRVLLRGRAAAARHGVPIYHEHLHKGLLRHLVARVAVGTGEVLCGIVVRRGGAPQVARMAQQLFDELRDDGLVGVVENENPKPTNVVLGPRSRTLQGRGELEERADGLVLRTSLTSFAQVNAAQAEVLYREVLDRLAPLDGARVLDLYAGYGPIALRAANAGASVIAVERNPSAVRDGRRAAAENGLAERVEFRTGDAGEALRSAAAEGLDAVVVDPPRRGLGDETVETLRDLEVPRLVYVSCNPVTMIRDLERLDGAFRLRTLRPVDLFPRTAHLECVAALERRPSRA